LVQHEQNRGLAAARNTAIAAAKGDVLAFLDVDASADPDWLGVLLSGFDDARIAGVGGQGVESNILSLADRWRKAHASQTHGQAQKDVPFLYGLCMSYRRTALQQVEGFDTSFRTNGEDVDIGLRLQAAGYRLRYMPSAKVYHQRTDDLLSLQRTMEAWYTGAYRARYVNCRQPWKLFAGTLRRLWTDPILDLAVERSPELALLSWRIGWRKLLALWREAREAKAKESAV
jgi:GT2 family glycosyltransferase